MTTILVDHNLEGQAVLLWGTIAAQGWPALIPLDFVTFAELGLDVTSSDREVWRLAQSRSMLLLTGNRNATGTDSLGQTIRDKRTDASLPVLTVGNVDRLQERDYRTRCAERVVDIVLDLRLYLGTGRLFIP